MEFVHAPIALVGKFTIGVVEISFAIHEVVFPMAFVDAAFVVVKFAETIPHTIFLLPLVPASLILFNNILILVLPILGAWVGVLIRFLFDGGVVVPSGFSFRGISLLAEIVSRGGRLGDCWLMRNRPDLFLCGGLLLQGDIVALGFCHRSVGCWFYCVGADVGDALCILYTYIFVFAAAIL